MPQRRALSEIPPNRAPRSRLSDAVCQEIFGRVCAGESQAEVARTKNLGESTIRAVVRRVNTRRTTANAPQSGRPRITNDRDRRRIIQLVRQNPLWTYSKLQYVSGLQISRSTFHFQRVLKENGIQNWIAKARPALTMGHAIDRLAFAQQNLNKDWSNTIISDECSVELGVGKRRQWAFGYPHQKWNTDKITTYNKSKGPSIMVWACISPSFGKSDLIIMTRDESAARNGYTSWSYVETLEAGLKPLYSGEEFQQDGASVTDTTMPRSTTTTNGDQPHRTVLVLVLGTVGTWSTGICPHRTMLVLGLVPWAPWAPSRYLYTSKGSPPFGSFEVRLVYILDLYIPSIHCHDYSPTSPDSINPHIQSSTSNPPALGNKSASRLAGLQSGSQPG